MDRFGPLAGRTGQEEDENTNRGEGLGVSWVGLDGVGLNGVDWGGWGWVGWGGLG